LSSSSTELRWQELATACPGGWSLNCRSRSTRLCITATPPAAGAGLLALLAGGPEQKQAIEKLSSSRPIAGSVAAGGDAPLQKADVIAYDTALLRQESETVYANPRSSAATLLRV